MGLQFLLQIFIKVTIFSALYSPMTKYVVEGKVFLNIPHNFNVFLKILLLEM